MKSRRAELDIKGAIGRVLGESTAPGTKFPVQDEAGMRRSGKAEWVARTHQAAERFLQAPLSSVLSTQTLSSGFLSLTLYAKFPVREWICLCFIGISQWLLLIPGRSDNPVFVTSTALPQPRAMSQTRLRLPIENKHLDPMNPYGTKALFSCRSVQ